MGKAAVKKIAVVKSAPVAAPSAPEKATRSLNLTLQVGLITFPIKLHTGARADAVAFKNLHSACLSPVKSQGGAAGSAYCPCCSEYIIPEEVVKGFEQSKGNFVVVTAAEIEAQRPGSDELIEVSTFVNASEIDPIYFQTSHYIAPGSGGGKAFKLVCESLKKTGKVAIGKATLYKNEHTVIIRPFGEGLALHLMFHENELNRINLPADTSAVTDGELKLMSQLIDGMAGKFDPLQYSDRYLGNLRALIASKQSGQAAPQIVRSTPKPAMDLMGALAASVAAAKNRKAA